MNIYEKNSEQCFERKKVKYAKFLLEKADIWMKLENTYESEKLVKHCRQKLNECRNSEQTEKFLIVQADLERFI